MAPTVFISYAHDSAEHKDQVLEFATFLRGQGVEAVLDVWSTEARRDWYSWAIGQLTAVDYVIVVASEKFRRAADGLGVPDEHRGIQSEAALLRELLVGDRATWLRKILPVVLPGHGVGEIPLFLQPHTASRYVVADFTANGAAELLRVLSGRPSHMAPPVAAAPVSVPALIGRHAELSRLAGLVAEVCAGRGRAVLVDGEPGIGKSALVAAACVGATGRCAVLWGAGDELGQALPLLPLLDALRGVGSRERGEAIARLLRGEVPLGGADPVAAASEQILAMVGELCAAGPVVLVVDDLHWADRPTLTVWSRLAKAAGDLRLLLIGMARPVPRTPELRALRRAAAVRLSLGPLPAPAVRQLLSAAVDASPGEGLLTLAAGAAGNPLFLTELVDALRRDDALRVESGVAELAGDRVPGSLVAAIESRLELAAGRVGEMLRAAALLGVEFSAAELAVVLGSRMPALTVALGEAMAAGVLRDAGEQLAFRHPLIHQVLYESIPATVRTAWHLDAARALAESGAPVHHVARQLLAAAHGSHLRSLDEWLTRWLVGAAPSLVALSPPLAVELLRAAVTGPVRADHEATVLACHLADALYRSGDAAEAERIAAELAASVTDPDLMVDLQWTLSQCRALTGRSQVSLADLERALGRPGLESRHHARLLVLTARTQRNLGNVGTAVEAADRALAEAEVVGDRWAMGWALHVLVIGTVMRGEVSEALPLMERALTVTDGDVTLADLRMLVLINQAVVLGDLDRYDQAIATANQVRALAERTGSLIRLAQAHSVLAELRFDMGHWDDALAAVDAIADYAADPSVACCSHGIAAVIELHRSRLTSARRHLGLVASDSEQIGRRVIGSLALARSLERELDGSREEALAVLTDCLTDEAEELDEVEDLLPDAVRLAVEIGDLITAAGLTERVRSLAERSNVPHRLGAAAYCRGLIDGDADALMSAARSFAEAKRPLPWAKALEAAGMAFAAHGDHPASGAALAAARGIYIALGANWDLTRLDSAQVRTQIGQESPALVSSPSVGQTPYEFLRQKIEEAL
ncbi:MAG: ATP-binding protein [Actinophytocola sp.]|uniref:ATP-binding protein n=1 Tax=Actinophytocola sp. TaxID=1872138 RepID=UPI003D6A807D